MPEPTPVYSLIHIGARTGSVSASYLYAPPQYTQRASVSQISIHHLDKHVALLCEWGYILDLRPLANHPNLEAWVYRQPCHDGRCRGTEISRFSREARQTAAQMMPFMTGTFLDQVALMASGALEPCDESAGPFDNVSAEYLAHYWSSRGARVGQNVGGVIQWNDAAATTDTAITQDVA